VSLETVLNVPCRGCDETVEVGVVTTDLERYVQRTGLVQNLFPYLDEDQREALIQWRARGDTLCPACWDAMFPDDEPDTLEE